MRILLIVTCLANIAVAFGTVPWMPNPAAVHFALDGTADGFAPPMDNAVLMSYIVGGMALMFLGISFLPIYCFNFPNRKYWLNEDNRQETTRRMRALMNWVGVWTMLFFLMMQWEMFQANQMVPPRITLVSSLGCILLLVVLIFKSVRVYLSFRLPKEKR